MRSIKHHSANLVNVACILMASRIVALCWKVGGAHAKRILLTLEGGQVASRHAQELLGLSNTFLGLEHPFQLLMTSSDCCCASWASTHAIVAYRIGVGNGIVVLKHIKLCMNRS